MRGCHSVRIFAFPVPVSTRSGAVSAVSFALKDVSVMGENVNVGRAVEWLSEVGGSASSGELGAALGVGHTTQAKVVKALHDAGLAEGSQRRLSLTAAGWARSVARDALAAGRTLDAAATGWEHAGAYSHAAWLRLMCSAVVARHHLADTRPRGHLGFMAIGETGTGKTSPVEQAAFLLGLDVTAVKRFLYTETPGSLLGRRERDADGYRLLPSEAARLPLLLLDEFDKADRTAQTMGWAFFQGETIAQHEGQAWPVRPVPVLTANPPGTGARGRLLRPEYRRRCAVLDTGYMRGRGGILEDMLTAYYRDARPGMLRIDQLTPPADRLSGTGLDVLRLVRDVLTDAGREEFPGVDALELAALGRLALAGTGDHRAAAYATGLDYLLVSETVTGQVAHGWQLDMAAVRRFLGDDAAGPLAVVVDAARAGRERATAHARAQAVDREKIADDLTHDRDALAERLRLAAAAIGPRRLGMLGDDRKADAAGVRGVLGKLRRETLDSRSAARLGEVADRAGAPLADAALIAREVAAERDRRDRERQQAAQQRAYAAQAAARAREQAKASQRAAIARQRAELAQVTDRAKQLEALYLRTTTRDGERPLDTLRKLDRVYYVPPAALAAPSGKVARAVERAFLGPPEGSWHVRGNDAVSFPGRDYMCPTLAHWGEGTRTALAPELAVLHAWEDNLRYQLGRPPRKGRPQVAASLPGTGRRHLAITSG